MALVGFFSNLLARFSAYCRYRRTLIALSPLDERVQADIGVYSGRYEAVARGLTD